PRDFATNVLTLITPPGNPAGVTGLDDSLDGARLVVCADGVPCGNATRDLAAAARVDLHPVSEESKVTDVRSKVTSGEADAGIVYATDAIAAGDDADVVAIAGADAHANRHPLAVVEGAADPGLARAVVHAGTGPAVAPRPAAPAPAPRPPRAAGAAAADPGRARAFVGAVTGPDGGAVLADHGFGAP